MRHKYFQNKGWRGGFAGFAAGMALVSLTAQPLHAAAANSPEALSISFSLPEIQTGQYQRPYTAVWVEDASGKAVKTLAVWHGDKKWLKDLRRWWRKTGRYQDGDIDGATGATKGPGQYSLSWDGTDSAGKPVAEGEYQLVLEASREHGSRTLLKQKFMLPDSSKTYRIKAGKELGPATIEQAD